jgi:hypothetical protein
MEDLLKSIREELTQCEVILNNDINEFTDKINLTRKNVSDYLDRQIEYLINSKKLFNEEFDYLEKENTTTCQINQQTFEKLCLSINQNDRDITIVSQLFEKFKQTFPIRPKMLKNIPEYHFQDIQIDDYIQKQKTQIIFNDENKSSDHSFIPIDDVQPAEGSIGFSHHKQFAQE